MQQHLASADLALTGILARNPAPDGLTHDWEVRDRPRHIRASDCTMILLGHTTVAPNQGPAHRVAAAVTPSGEIRFSLPTEFWLDWDHPTVFTDIPGYFRARDLVYP